MAVQNTKRKSQTVRASHETRQGHNSRKARKGRSNGNAPSHLRTSRTETHEGYAVIFEKSKTGYGAYSPDVLGCVAVGGTLSETRRLYKSALKMHLKSMREDGDLIPEPTTKVEYVAA